MGKGQRSLREPGRMASKEVEMIRCEGEAGSQMQPTVLPALPIFLWKDAHRQFVAPSWRAAAARSAGSLLLRNRRGAVGTVTIWLGDRRGAVGTVTIWLGDKSGAVDIVTIWLGDRSGVVGTVTIWLGDRRGQWVQ